MRACWYYYGQEWRPGKFHEWGTEELEVGYQSIGIVETENHAIVTVLPEKVYFGWCPEEVFDGN